MNEQLVVKNFGPIKDATVDFKRVTVFIGPTGGGKSTLAKLAAVFRDGFFDIPFSKERYKYFNYFSIDSYLKSKSNLKWIYNNKIYQLKNKFSISITSKNDKLKLISSGINGINVSTDNGISSVTLNVTDAFLAELIQHLGSSFDSEKIVPTLFNDKAISIVKSFVHPFYFTSNRNIVSALEYSWAGFLRDDIELPKDVLSFANSFATAKKNVTKLTIPFLNAKYIHRNSQDLIQIHGIKTLFRLYETASGIQSVTPMLVLLEHLSRNTEQAQSFIIEEPELNLYPTAQQGLLNWLVEKCTKGENDLTLTTHSPYILSHLNLLLYAYQVAEQHPGRADEVAELVPRESWINPAEFACYQVENGGVTSLVNTDLGLIDDNGLDGLSGDAADAFDNLIRLSKGVKLK